MGPPEEAEETLTDLVRLIWAERGEAPKSKKAVGTKRR